MSAYKDQNSPVQFYFGNAAQDLSHLLPAEDEAELQTEASSIDSLEAQMSHLEELDQEMGDCQARLNFLLRDLKNIFG